MYDGIHISSDNPVLFGSLLQKLNPCLTHKINKVTGEVLQTSGQVDGWYVNLGNDGVRSTLRGSMHKNYTGRGNDTVYTFAQVVETVTNLANVFGVPSSSLNVMRLEFGVNVPVQVPETMIEAAIMYKNRVPSTYKNKKFYGKMWEFDEYVVKLYKKGSQLVRYEIKFMKSRVAHNRYKTLLDLVDKDNFIYGLVILLKHASMLTFVPSKITGVPDKDKIKLLAYRDPATWDNLKSYEKTRFKKSLDQLIEKYNLINWQAYLRKHIISQGAAMLEVSLEEMNATFSCVRLEGETRAVGERQTVKQKEPEEAVNKETTINKNEKPRIKIIIIPWCYQPVDVSAYTDTRVSVYRSIQIRVRGPP